jgi:hypothetical protein
MARKPVVCRLGFHSYVQAHPRDERQQGPDRDRVCRRCGKRSDGNISGLPPTVVT